MSPSVLLTHTTTSYQCDFYFYFYFTFTFSHLADAIIQSDLQIRKKITKIKSTNYKYYIYTFKKIKKLNKNDKCIQHFKINI